MVVSLRVVFLSVAAFTSLVLSPSLGAHNDGAYRNSSTPGAQYPNWMTSLSDDLRLSDLSIPGTHDSGAYSFGGVTTETQSMNIGNQLNAGIRFLDLRVGENGVCSLHLFHGFTCQYITWQEAVDAIVAFLTANPGETVIARVKKEHGSPNFANVKSALGSHYYGAGSGETKTNPTLGELRGKIFVLYNEWGEGNTIGPRGWPSCAVDSIGTQTCQDHYSLSDNWDLEEKWKDWVVPFFEKADDVRGDDSTNRDALYINHLSAAVGGFPYFFASGHSSWETSAPRLLTGWTRGLINTCSGNAQCIAEYPNVNCVDFFGVSGSETCSVAFEGINILARNYILANIQDRAGIVVADFPGPSLISAIIKLNPWRDSAVADAGGAYEENFYAYLEGLDTARLYPGNNLRGSWPMSWRWDTDGDGNFDTPYSTDIVSLTATDDDYFGEVCIEVKDKFGSIDTDCTYLEFANLRPDFLNFNLTNLVVEGQTATVQGYILDPGLDSHVFDIDWNGDTAWDTQVALPVSATPCPSPYQDYYCKPFSSSFVYPDNGTPDVTFTIELRDDDGGTIRHQQTIKVLNSTPVFDEVLLTNGNSGEFIAENDVIPAGTLVNLNVFFSDPGTNDTHSAVVYWGDGAESSLPDIVEEFSIGHTYTLVGAKQITVTLTDDDNGTQYHWSPNFFVQNPPPPPDTSPVADAGGPYSVNESFFITADASGSTVFGNRTAWYRWDFDNDGVWDTPRTTNPISPSWHGPNPDFKDDYTGQLKLEVWDGSEAATDLADVEFYNLGPEVFANFSDYDINEGDTVVLTVDITDAYDDFTVYVDWNGDSVNDETVVLPPKVTKTSLIHTFANNPPGDDFEAFSEINVGVTVIDDDGDSGYDQPAINVYNIAPEVTIWQVVSGEGVVLGPPPQFDSDTVPAGVEVIVSGFWSDPGIDDAITLVIDWGDGSTTELDPPSDIYFDESHVYTTYGPRQISVTVKDGDFGEGSDSWPVFEVIDWMFGDGFE